MERKILINKVMCPDGTILESHHRHDYKEYTDKLGRYTMVDGGRDYLKRGGTFTEMSVYSDDSHEVIRREVTRIGRGKNLDQQPFITPVMAMNDSWLKNVIEWCEDYQPNNPFLDVFKEEVLYRKKHGISIKEKD